MGTSLHPLRDLLLPLKKRGVRGRLHPYQIMLTRRGKKCFVNRCLFDSK